MLTQAKHFYNNNQGASLNTTRIKHERMSVPQGKNQSACAHHDRGGQKQTVWMRSSCFYCTALKFISFFCFLTDCLIISWRKTQSSIKLCSTLLPVHPDLRRILCLAHQEQVKQTSRNVLLSCLCSSFLCCDLKMKEIEITVHVGNWWSSCQFCWLSTCWNV